MEEQLHCHNPMFACQIALVSSDRMQLHVLQLID